MRRSAAMASSVDRISARNGSSAARPGIRADMIRSMKHPARGVFVAVVDELDGDSLPGMGISFAIRDDREKRVAAETDWSSKRWSPCPWWARCPIRGAGSNRQRIGDRDRPSFASARFATWSATGKGRVLALTSRRPIARKYRCFRPGRIESHVDGVVCGAAAADFVRGDDEENMRAFSVPLGMRTGIFQVRRPSIRRYGRLVRLGRSRCGGRPGPLRGPSPRLFQGLLGAGSGC